MSAYAFTAAAFVIATVIVWAPEWTAALRRFLRDRPEREGASADAAFRLRGPRAPRLRSPEDGLFSGEPWQRKRALEKVAALPAPQAADILLPLLSRVSDEDRSAWIQTLLNLGDPRVPPALFRWLEGVPARHLSLGQTEKETDPKEPKVVELFQAYGARNRRIQNEVARLLRASQLGCATKADPRLLKQAIVPRGASEDAPPPIPLLSRTGQSPFERARHLSTQLRNDEKTALPLVLESMSFDESPYVRAVAASLLRDRSEEKVRKALLASTRDPHENVRWSAVRSLARSGDPGLHPSLRQIEDSDPSEAVRRAAGRALKRLAS